MPAKHPPQPFLAAAKTFLASLDSGQRAKTVLAFDSDERKNWKFVPAVRKGLTWGEMNADQRKAALVLLRAGLSAQGYKKAETIRSLEPVLRELENGNTGRDPNLYYFALFGTPSEKETWGWRYEGHHISLNWTVVEGRVIGDSPEFLGANPAHVLSGPLAGTRALKDEEDRGRALVASLDAAQRKEAILTDRAPGDILTGAAREAGIQEDRGIAYSALHPEQQRMLLALIGTYADTMPRPIAEARMAKIRRAGLASVRFAWMGGLAPGQGHYYRIQGPTFLAEYDNTQNNANHIHTVWRDFRGDWGEDLLAEHYKAAHGG